MLARVRGVAGPAVQLAKPEVAVRDEGPHSQLGGERQGLAVVALCPGDLERITIDRDLTEQTECPALQTPLPAVSMPCEPVFSGFPRCLEVTGQEVNLGAPRRKGS